MLFEGSSYQCRIQRDLTRRGAFGGNTHSVKTPPINGPDTSPICAAALHQHRSPVSLVLPSNIIRTAEHKPRVDCTQSVSNHHQQAPANRSHSRGLFSNGVEFVRICMPPFINPAAPSPATARPAISIEELVATAQINDPNSKTKRWARKTCLVRRWV
jgi:hypothetical protein